MDGFDISPESADGWSSVIAQTIDTLVENAVEQLFVSAAMEM